MIPDVFKRATLWYKLWHGMKEEPSKALLGGRKYKEESFDFDGEEGNIWFDSSFQYSDHRRPFGVLEIHAYLNHPSFGRISFYIAYRERHRQVAYAKGDNIKFARYYRRVLPHVKKDVVPLVEHFLALALLTKI